MITERIRQIIDYKNISERQFCKEIEVANGFLSKVKDVGSSKLSKILYKYPEIDPLWLLNGEGNMLKKHNKTENSDEILCEHSIPLIPINAIAGYSKSDNSSILPLDCDYYIIPDLVKKGAEFLTRVSGSSMFPTFISGDILACKKIQDVFFFQWGKIYVIDTSQGVIVKRIYPSENNDMIKCVSDNKDLYYPFEIPKSDIRSVSIVVGSIHME